MKLSKEEIEAIQEFLDAKDSEGLSYAANEYPPSSSAPKTLCELVKNYQKAYTELENEINKLENVLMREYA